MKKDAKQTVGAARLKARLAQWIIRVQARGLGIAPTDLVRFEEYVRFTLHAENPAYTNPLQQPRNYFPGLTAKPWHNPADFEWTARLEKNWDRIKREALALPGGIYRTVRNSPVLDGSWNEYFLYVQRRPLKKNCRTCPQTAEILGSLSNLSSPGEALFSILGPGTHIQAHGGNTNAKLRCQLALQVPVGGGIRVGTETRSWEEGRCILFDDSFEHEVWNAHGGKRIVLIFDVWHPELSEAEKWAIGRFTEMTPKAWRFRKYAKSTQGGGVVKRRSAQEEKGDLV